MTWLDEPSKSVKSPIEYLRGWVAVADPEVDLTIRCGRHQLPSARNLRPDLDPGSTIGFSAHLDLTSIGSEVAAEVSIDVFQGELCVGSFRLSVEEQARQSVTEVRENKIRKKRFLADAFRQPVAELADGTFNALPDSWRQSARVEGKVDPVSANDYSGDIHEFLSSFPREAFILDAGAGLRRRPARNVINMEIYAYPSTDVLAIGQNLPFKDGAFDGVLSLAVLEHVDNPIQCANELLRVLKPGGRVLVSIPFLQAEHGYPSHYFNATRFGVQQLFKEAALKRQWLEMSNHPVFTLNQILGEYSAGLPSDVRERFNRTTIGDFLCTAPLHFWETEHEFTKLSEDRLWALAWGTTAVFEKRVVSSG